MVYKKPFNYLPYTLMIKALDFCLSNLFLSCFRSLSNQCNFTLDLRSKNTITLLKFLIKGNLLNKQKLFRGQVYFSSSDTTTDAHKTATDTFIILEFMFNWIQIEVEVEETTMNTLLTGSKICCANDQFVYPKSMHFHIGMKVKPFLSYSFLF